MKYAITVGSHTRFEGKDAKGAHVSKTYRVGDEIELTPQQAAALNARQTRVLPLDQYKAMLAQQAETEKLAAAESAGKPAARAKRS